MPPSRVSPDVSSRIIKLYVLGERSNKNIARVLAISDRSVCNYKRYYKQSSLPKSAPFLLDSKALIGRIHPVRPPINNQRRSESLITLLPGIHNRLMEGKASLKQLWLEYSQKEPSGYGYHYFLIKYRNWRKANKLKRNVRYKWNLDHIAPEDLELLHKWRLSADRRKWEKAVALLELHKGGSITDISRKIERSKSAITCSIVRFRERGLEHIDLRWTQKATADKKKEMGKKSDRIIKLLHEPPSLHNINRASWGLDALSKAYKEHYGDSISMSTIARYLHSMGYSIKKAKIVLTSPDPDYREKLDNIKRILSNLKENEKFFSIDEYGPFAVKAQGGRSFTPKGQWNTVLKYQTSKGSLIFTAALELSTNQITHFYSDKKNTAEMIKLLMILLENYKTEGRIFLSWDAVSWHKSKTLGKKVVEVNDPEYRRINNTPIVELAPLPSSAQFLNVIESVFSGMARAIIHNSDYQSVDECKVAIDRYFAERNTAFLENPKRAGKKIWGKELVKPVFKDSNNCKDSKYR